jgi:taurine dioxygenase
MQAQYPPAEHPVIRTHPETGRKLVFVNRVFTTHITGMSPDESNRLLEYLYLRAWVPEYQCRFRWEKNCVAFWDNRVTQHYAVGDYLPNWRVMHGVRIVGDRPY